MRAPILSTPVKSEKVIAPVVQAAAAPEAGTIPPTEPEEPALRRDWIMLLVWLGGAVILVLLHFVDLLEWLFKA